MMTTSNSSSARPASQNRLELLLQLYSKGVAAGFNRVFWCSIK